MANKKIIDIKYVLIEQMLANVSRIEPAWKIESASRQADAATSRGREDVQREDERICGTRRAGSYDSHVDNRLASRVLSPCADRIRVGSIDRLGNRLCLSESNRLYFRICVTICGTDETLCCARIADAGVVSIAQAGSWLVDMYLRVISRQLNWLRLKQQREVWT